MAFNPFAKKKEKFKSALPPRPEPEEQESEIEGNRGLPSLFDKGITLQGERLNLLKKGLENGIAFFNEFNNGRMELAFQSFTEDMKHALFEVLFFLHVNDSSFSEIKFTVEQQGDDVEEACQDDHHGWR